MKKILFDAIILNTIEEICGFCDEKKLCVQGKYRERFDTRGGAPSPQPTGYQTAYICVDCAGQIYREYN